MDVSEHLAGYQTVLRVGCSLHRGWSWRECVVDDRACAATTIGDRPFGNPKIPSRMSRMNRSARSNQRISDKNSSSVTTSIGGGGGGGVV